MTTPCRRGMTLIELVVALTITGFVVAAGYGTLAALTDRRAQLSEATDAVARVAAARRTLEDWLSQAMLRSDVVGPPFRGLNAVREGDPDDDLTFLTRAHTGLGAPETIVHLFVGHDPGSASRGLIAELAAWPGGERQTIVLAPQASALRVQYLGQFSGSRVWQNSWVSTSLLPLGVRLQLSASDTASLPPLWRLPVTVVIGAGQ